MATFDITKTDNDFWVAVEHFTAISDDEDGVKDIITKFGGDPAKAKGQTKKELLEYLNSIKTNAINVLQAIGEVDIATIKMKAYLNWSASDTALWGRIVGGKILWLIADDSKLNKTSYRTLTNLASELANAKAEAKKFENEMTKAQADLAIAQKTPNAAGVASYENKIKKLEDDLKKAKSAQGKNWTDSQRQEIADLYAPIQRAYMCCYPKEDQMLYAGVWATQMQMFEWKGDQAFKEVKKMLVDFNAGRPAHPADGTKDQSICDAFDMKDFDAVDEALWNKWRSIGAAPAGAGALAASVNWVSSMASAATSWFATSRAKAVAHRPDHIATKEAATSYPARLAQNYTGWVLAPFDAMRAKDGSAGVASWTVGVLGSALATPFALVGLVGNIFADIPAKLFRGETLTAQWNRSWFKGTKVTN